MSRPTTKGELLKQSGEQFRALNAYIDSLDVLEQRKEFPEGTMNRNIRDVLAHLHQWHQMFLEWYKVGMRGIKPQMPFPGYNWKQTPALNEKIWSDYQAVDLSHARKLLNTSHQAVQKIIENHTEEELFTKKRYRWTGSSSLATYLRANTSSHYRWALKLIRKQTSQSNKS